MNPEVTLEEVILERNNVAVFNEHLEPKLVLYNDLAHLQYRVLEKVRELHKNKGDKNLVSHGVELSKTLDSVLLKLKPPKKYIGLSFFTNRTKLPAEKIELLKYQGETFIGVADFIMSDNAKTVARKCK